MGWTPGNLSNAFFLLRRFQKAFVGGRGAAGLIYYRLFSGQPCTHCDRGHELDFHFLSDYGLISDSILDHNSLQFRIRFGSHLGPIMIPYWPRCGIPFRLNFGSHLGSHFVYFPDAVWDSISIPFWTRLGIPYRMQFGSGVRTRIVFESESESGIVAIRDPNRAPNGYRLGVRNDVRIGAGL